MAGILELNLPDNTDEPFVTQAEEEMAASVASQNLNAVEDAVEGFKTTALYGGVRRAIDEGTAAAETFDETQTGGVQRGIAVTTGAIQGLFGNSHDSGEDWDRDVHRASLTKGVPFAYREDIMTSPTLDAAIRSRARVTADLKVQTRMSRQWDGGGANMVGSFLDVDMPLMFATGGMFGAAKVARGVAKLTSSQRAIGAAQGVTGGIQSGLIVGGYDALVRETSDETTLIASIFAGAALGGGLGSIGGDMSRSVSDLERSTARRVAEDDPSLGATTDTVDIIGPTKPFGPSTVGAAQVEETAAGAVNNRGSARLTDPLGPIHEESAAIIDHAADSNHETGFYDRKAEQTGWVDRMAASAWNGPLGASFQAKLYSSDSAVMNWLGSSVYESASGLNRGAATAAVMMENYHARIMTQLLPVEVAMSSWSKRNSSTWMNTGYSTSMSGRAKFYREVKLERNAREHGYARTTDEDVRLAADSYDNAARESLSIGKGRDDQHSVFGMEDVKDNPHYSPLVWSGAKITSLIASGRVTRENIIAAVAASYRNAGMGAGKDADAVAEAVIRRAELNDADIDGSVHSLLQGDGKEFLRDSLERGGLDRDHVDGIMKRLGDAADERGKEGFAKRRNAIDLYEDILTEADGLSDSVKIVDLLDDDLSGTWQRYARRMAGSSALARQGITSKAGRKAVIAAVHAEQRALGETITPAQELHAMFSHFDGGPVKGWSELISGKGSEPAAAGPAAALAKRMVNLAWLGKLGMTQLGETGAVIHKQGIQNFLQTSGMRNFAAEIKAGNKALLDEMSFLVGSIGEEQRLFAQHLNLDEVSGIDGTDLMSRVNKFASDASYVQGYISLFNTVRGWQQKTAALGVVNKVFKELRVVTETGEALTPGRQARMWSDLGLDAETITRMENLITSGVIEFSPDGFVNKMNIDKWDGDLQDIVGSSITRNINQVVQKSMAGEQDAWISTGFGSVLSHLKTFPMGATHKQFARHFRHNDPEAYGVVVAGLATAGVASIIREGIDQAGGKESEWMSSKDHAKRAFGYSNMTGFMPMAYDPLMTVLGMEDKRFNQYGRHSEIMPPVLSWANDAIRLPGALGASFKGTADYDDMKAKRTLPFANTILFGQMMQSAGQEKK